jgi:D-tyrosyl-tRNA(Tyr) deacylase
LTLAPLPDGHTADGSSACSLRLVTQRVKGLRLVADGHDRGGFEQGLVVYAGFSGRTLGGFSEASLALAARKIFALRTFGSPDLGNPNDTQTQRMEWNVRQLPVGRGVALISQFTLWGDCRRGNRPGFQMASPPEVAKLIYHRLEDHFRSESAQDPRVPLITGIFGADMQVSYCNDGPITYVFDIVDGRIVTL